MTVSLRHPSHAYTDWAPAKHPGREVQRCTGCHAEAYRGPGRQHGHDTALEVACGVSECVPGSGIVWPGGFFGDTTRRFPYFELALEREGGWFLAQVPVAGDGAGSGVATFDHMKELGSGGRVKPKRGVGGQLHE